MPTLRRTVRLPIFAAPPGAGGNGLVSVSPASDVSPMVEFDVECSGAVAKSGYLIDIGIIDRAAREHLPPILRDVARAELAGSGADLRGFLSAAADSMASALPAELCSLTYRPSPYRSAMIERPLASDQNTKDPAMNPATPASFLLTETFEFAASHRLHLSGASDAENRAMFGKCNNPNGHGHNYRIEVAVEIGAAAGPRALDFAAIERIVQAEIMARFDHKHLNLDCPEFAGLNPSVEHIAMVCHGLLAPRFSEAGGALRFVRVWETDKTSCRYPA